jgi:hypothetical protein
MPRLGQDAEDVVHPVKRVDERAPLKCQRTSCRGWWGA